MLDSISSWIDSLNWLEQIYSIAAFVGLLVFIIQFILSFVGHGMSDQDPSAVLDDIGLSDYAIRFASLQTISSFLWMGGVFGLYSESVNHNHIVSVIVALLVGGGFSFLIYKFKKMIIGLQSNGVVKNENTIGKDGKVYLLIPKGGVGQVEVIVQERQVYMKAVSKDGEEIQTGLRVKVVDVTTDSILIVQKI
ncbi:MAG: hypothetical protein ACI4V7_10260 [Succinivibrionaceae bacterium]